MSDEIERLIYRVEASVEQFERSMKKANRAAYGSAAAIKKELDKIKRDMDRTGREVAASFHPMQAAAQVAFAAITAYSIKAAADAAEIENAFEVAFGSSAKDAKKFATELAQEVGRSVTEIQSGMSRMQLVLTGMGVGAEKALKLTEALTQRGIDIGSLWNVSDAEALQAIISGISGETEPMKRFGAVVNETAVKAELLRLGFKGNAEAAPDAAKAIARTNLILQKTASANGDAARTAESTSNQFKRARAEFHDAAISLGNELLPAVTKVVGKTADLIDAFSKLPDGVKLGGLALLGLAAASGPIASTVGALAKLIEYAKAARLALAGVAGAEAAATAAGVGGAAAGAARRGGAGRLVGAAAGFGLAGLAVADGVVLLDAGARVLDTKQKDALRRRIGAGGTSGDLALMGSSDQELAETLNFAKGLTIAGSTPEDRARTKALNDSAISAITQEVKRRAAAQTQNVQADADAAASAALASFGLSGDELKAVGGKGSDKAAKDAERLRQQALDREARTNSMIAAADDALIAARQRMAVEADERLQLELQAIDRERQARRKDLDLAVQQGEIEAAQRKKIDAAEEAVRQQLESNAKREAALAAQDDEVRAQQQIADFTADLLSVRSQLARTAEERRRIELDLLKLHQDERRRALERASVDERLTQAQRDAARTALGGLGELEGAERRSVERNNLGPLAAWRDAGLQSAEEVSEAMEGAAVRGLEAFNDGIVDAIVNFKSLGDVAKSVLKQVQADLVSIGVRKFITQPLADFLFGGGEGGGGGLGSLLKLGGKFAGFFATGGTIPAGQWGIAGEKGPEPVMGPARVLPNSVFAGAAGGSRSVDFRMTINLEGANGDATIRRIAQDAAAQGAALAYQASMRDGQTVLRRRQSRSLNRG